MEIRHEKEHAVDATASQINVSTWHGEALETTGRQLCIVRGICPCDSWTGGGRAGGLDCFIEELQVREEWEAGWGWSRGRIHKAGAHRFDPDVYSRIWRAAFGTYLVLTISPGMWKN